MEYHHKEKVIERKMMNRRRPSTDTDKAGAVPPPSLTKTMKKSSPRTTEKQEKNGSSASGETPGRQHQKSAGVVGRQLVDSACQRKPPPPQPGAYFVNGSFVERADLNTCSSSSRGGDFRQQHDDEEDIFLDFKSSKTTRPDSGQAEEANHDILVAAQLSEDAEVELEAKLRRRLLKDIAQASVVLVTQPALLEDDSQSNPPLDMSYNMHKNVKEKLFGRRVEVDIAATPERYIRTRDFLPWKVQQNPTTKLWVASVQTCETTEDPLEIERSMQKFVASTQDEARELGLAMARPKMQPFDENPICYLCKVKFAVFWRPSHCRNCGVCICKSCSTSWPSKMLPETYKKSSSSSAVGVFAMTNVCLACDWLVKGFRNALLDGNFVMALELYQTGNLNLRTPYLLEKKRAEVFYPIHMAILGGNLELVQWLASERCCPLRAAAWSTRKKKKSLDQQRGGRGDTASTTTMPPLVTSKGRSPIHLALPHSRVDILRYLVADKKLSLLEDVTEEADILLALRHLTSLLLVPVDDSSSAILQRSSSIIGQEEERRSSCSDDDPYYDEANENGAVEGGVPSLASCQHSVPRPSISSCKLESSIASWSSTSTVRRGSF